MTSALTTDLDRQTLILLSAPMSIGGGAVPSFGPAAWHDLQRILIYRRLSPGQLLDMSETDLESRAGLTADQAHRVSVLLGRGGPLAIEIERLASRGIWITTLGEESYPRRLAETLGDQAPPLLFGVGSHPLAGQDSLAIVGSRDADEEALGYAESVAASAVKGGLAIVSGAARGIDAAAMTSALEHGGSVIGVVADGLEKRIREPQVRAWLADDRLCLLTPYGSNTGFSVGAAMGRNKLIYAMSAWSLVAAATPGKGGTWAGAAEALKNKWSTVFYRKRLDTGSATGFQSLGALPLGEPVPDAVTAEWLQSQVPSGADASEDGGEAGGNGTPTPLQETLFGGPVVMSAQKAKRKRPGSSGRS